MILGKNQRTPQACGKFTLPNGAEGPLKIIITESLDSV